MKKISFLIFCNIFNYFCVNFYANEALIKNILFTEDITIGIRIDQKSRNLAGVISFKNGKILSEGNGTTSVLINPDYHICNDYLEIYFSRLFAKNFFDSNRTFIVWSFPERLKIKVNADELKKAQQAWNKFVPIQIDNTKTYPTTCQAIVIDNLNIRDQPSLTGEKIGQFEKRTEVTLYEESKNIDEIDGEKNPWYKVKLDDNTYGWVYGGYVRIFFEDPNLGYSDKELILKSIE